MFSDTLYLLIYVTYKQVQFVEFSFWFGICQFGAELEANGEVASHEEAEHGDEEVVGRQALLIDLQWYYKGEIIIFFINNIKYFR